VRPDNGHGGAHRKCSIRRWLDTARKDESTTPGTDYNRNGGDTAVPRIELAPSDYQPAPPAKKDYGIGFVGCGGIGQGAHLPAYKNCGYRVVAACDIVEETVRRAQERFGIPRITTRIEDILDNRDVQIIDLAVHGSQRLPIIRQICEARPAHLLGILSQKPFAMNWNDAVEMVELCQKAAVPLMVNQQARWAPAHRAMKVLLERGVFGHVYCVTHFHRSFQDQPGSWYVRLENFNIVDHGIHYIDLCRYFTGLNPVRVKATATMQPGQAAVSPMCHTILMEFARESQITAISHFNNIVRTGPLHRYEWFVDGTEASAMTNGSQVTVAFRDGERETFPIAGSWFPDAFGGSMGELMRAITEGREPQTSGRDNLNSIRIAYAAVESAATGVAVTL
jgi:predicted dehydrogenase